VLTTVVGEYLCLRDEMNAIPLRSVIALENNRNKVAQL